jgi:hypothetical protein
MVRTKGIGSERTAGHFQYRLYTAAPRLQRAGACVAPVAAAARSSAYHGTPEPLRGRKPNLLLSTEQQRTSQWSVCIEALYYAGGASQSRRRTARTCRMNTTAYRRQDGTPLGARLASLSSAAAQGCYSPGRYLDQIDRVDRSALASALGHSGQCPSARCALV